MNEKHLDEELDELFKRIIALRRKAEGYLSKSPKKRKGGDEQK